eukprot:2944571-Rhodomonas_salina.4
MDRVDPDVDHSLRRHRAGRAPRRTWTRQPVSGSSRSRGLSCDADSESQSPKPGFRVQGLGRRGLGFREPGWGPPGSGQTTRGKPAGCAGVLHCSQSGGRDMRSMRDACRQTVARTPPASWAVRMCRKTMLHQGFAHSRARCATAGAADASARDREKSEKGLQGGRAM